MQWLWIGSSHAGTDWLNTELPPLCLGHKDRQSKQSEDAGTERQQDEQQHQAWEQKEGRRWIIQAAALVSSRPGSTPAPCVSRSANDAPCVLLQGSGWVAKASKWRVMWNIRCETGEAPALNQQPRRRRGEGGEGDQGRRKQGNFCHVSMNSAIAINLHIAKQLQNSSKKPKCEIGTFKSG